MRKIRVLIVDDSIVIRKLLTDALSAEPAIEVVGSAANGRIALDKLPQFSPDLVTLDVEMPEMDGLETLAVFRKTYPKLPVIMFSTLTQRGAGSTLEALALGASDYVTKPANVGSVSAGIQRIREELIPKIKALCGRVVGMERSAPALPARTATGNGLATNLRTSPAGPRTVSQRVDIVAIGVSTGGPQALAALLPQLPTAFPVPIVVVQHMPAMFTKLLAERLATQSTIKVSEGVVGGILTAGKAWVAPGDYHMVLERKGTAICLRMHQGPPENSCRPAVDVLFRSVAEMYGPHVLGVVLTGMGQDGLRGCEAIKAAGGQIVVQDEASSVVWGMPGFVARAGLADTILPLNRLATEIIRRAEQPPGTIVAQRGATTKSRVGQV
jgi:two-component system, chemotaxis family, protein-glutamate methylesterase/glutaminase